MSVSVLDPRQRRTRQALVQAVLALAADQPVREISVSALARAAGVHRSTVYQHAPSPAALLVSVLQAELDLVRERHLAGLAPGQLGAAGRGVVRAVLDHLESHAALYRRELADPVAPLGDMLREHFAESVRGMIDTHRLAPPGVERLGPEGREMVARWVAEGSVGAMTAWLLGPAPRDPENYLALHAALLPGWWPRWSA